MANSTTIAEIDFEILKEKKKYQSRSTGNLLKEVQRLDQRQTTLYRKWLNIDKSDQKAWFTHLGKLLWCNKLLGAVLEILRSRQRN